MTMLVCLLERRVTWLQLLVNWTCSLVGNWLGALFAAYFLSYLPGALSGPDQLHYLEVKATEKTAHNFGECFLLGVGCNTYVCLAVWFVIASDEAAGKIIAMWFPIVAFCVAGYEHIVANFFTLQCALLYGVAPGVGTVIVKNFLPTLLGNIVGGCGLVGAVYWFNFYPTVCYVPEPICALPSEGPAQSAGRQVITDLFNRDGHRTSLLGATSSVDPKNCSSAIAGAALQRPFSTTVTSLQENASKTQNGPVTLHSLLTPSGPQSDIQAGGEATEEIVLPRTSFGGEYAWRPPTATGGKPNKHPIGSGGSMSCRVAGLQEQPSASFVSKVSGGTERTGAGGNGEAGGATEGPSEQASNPAARLTVPSPGSTHFHVAGPTDTPTPAEQ
ncbi:formate nitrite transporter protein [Cystoisospora suis]|uniref:Formate nitrite transporter protein n=1 Tax=Cystoisospora suis TaxID=483139 RepID=A0A2C6L6K3_9APIC|nr:formate nitrite transporter protein [Cystoisospora suis]